MQNHFHISKTSFMLPCTDMCPFVTEILSLTPGGYICSIISVLLSERHYINLWYVVGFITQHTTTEVYPGLCMNQEVIPFLFSEYSHSGCVLVHVVIHGKML